MPKNTNSRALNIIGRVLSDIREQLAFIQTINHDYQRTTSSGSEATLTHN